MRLGSPSRRQFPVGQTVAKPDSLFCGMQQFTEDGMVSRHKLMALGKRSLQHQRGFPLALPLGTSIRILEPGDVTLAWHERSNQANLLLGFRLSGRQIGQSIQGVEIGPGGRGNDVGIGAVTRDGSSVLLDSH